MSQNKKSKKKPKPLQLGIGDLVQFQSPSQHLSGTVGYVTHILSKRYVVVKGIAPNDNDFPQTLWVCQTFKSNTGNHYVDECVFAITKVIHRAVPLPEVVKPVIEKKKINLETKEDVIAALSGEVEIGKRDIVEIGSPEEPVVVVPLTDASSLSQNDTPVEAHHE